MLELKRAIKYDNVGKFKKELKNHPDLNDVVMNTFFVFAVKYRRRKVLKYLLENKANSYQVSKKMLRLAIEIQDIKAVSLLLRTRDYEVKVLDEALIMAEEVENEHIYDLVYERLYN